MSFAGARPTLPESQDPSLLRELATEEVAVTQQILRPAIPPKCLAQLLGRPFRSRMGSYGHLPYFAAIGRNAMAIWQELVDTCGFGAGYKSVNRFVGKLGGNPSSEACAVIETAPGEELQVDYGTGSIVRDPHRGKYRRTRLFALTLGYSRKSVRLVVFRSSARIWASCMGRLFVGGRLHARCGAG